MHLYSIYVSGHTFDTNSVEAIQWLLQQLPKPIDPAKVLVFEWNDVSATYEQKLIDLFILVDLYLCWV